MASQHLNPFLLAANTPTPDPRLLPLLRANSMLASAQDDHGYSLLHAAASYDHPDLLRALVNEFKVDVNLKDEDGETCLFVTESEEVAKCLIEELSIDITICNDEGLTAIEKITTEGDFPEVAAYLQSHLSNGNNRSAVGGSSAISQMNGSGHPPPLPPNMSIDINTTTEDELGISSEQAPDPEFRRRIEELAARENFNTEEGQRELRDLITDAVRGVSQDTREVRRRVDQ